MKTHKGHTMPTRRTIALVIFTFLLVLLADTLASSGSLRAAASDDVRRDLQGDNSDETISIPTGLFVRDIAGVIKTETFPASAKRIPPGNAGMNPPGRPMDPRAIYLKPRVVGGSTVARGAYPFFVRLDKNFYPVCGGSLVAPDVVLSAAHCRAQDVSEYGILVNGYHDDRFVNPDQRLRNVTEMEIHPNYSPSRYYNDIMLLKLNEPVFDIPLVELNRRSDLPGPDENVTVMGLGALFEGGGFPDLLQSVEVDMIDNEFCSSAYEGVGLFPIPDDIMLCAGKRAGAAKDACQGDSGGPLLNANGVQVGVISFGLGCARQEFPGVYARTAVRNGNDWLGKTLCRMTDTNALDDWCLTPLSSAVTSLSLSSPSNEPSIRPTSSPTAWPTASPTARPTLSESEAPSKAPTTSPTEGPTSSPTLPPTTDPTPSPTHTPSNSPTVSPTANPTTTPTLGPTDLPTGAPTTSPSNHPSRAPSSSPSTQPTQSPSSHPSEWLFDPIFINAGGRSFTDSSQIEWDADKYFVDGKTYSAGTSVRIDRTNDDTLYRTERWGRVKYEIPIGRNGDYSVTFYFAEVFRKTQTAGARVFDVVLEGETVIEKLDIVAEAGGYTATNWTVTTTVVDGALSVELLKDKGNPKISALEVQLASEARYPDTTRSPTSSPSSTPSQEPTITPTDEPETPQPSSSPSHAPSAAPSDKPSKSPSKVPTLTPTMQPTNSQGTTKTGKSLLTDYYDEPIQGLAAVGLPSDSPTERPTSSPSSSPSKKHVIPSHSPTIDPTHQPSSTPTDKPETSRPSLFPSETPSSLPSVEPTAQPSSIPSEALETSRPSSTPSGLPSSFPTTQPTQRPESSQPSLAPSNRPSGTPTEEPSLSPSVSPTSSPTDPPTETPDTPQPTGTPSDLPTLAPTVNPSESPTNIPSAVSTEDLYQVPLAGFGIEYVNSNTFNDDSSLQEATEEYLLQSMGEEFETLSRVNLRRVSSRKRRLQDSPLKATIYTGIAVFRDLPVPSTKEVQQVESLALEDTESLKTVLDEVGVEIVSVSPKPNEASNPLGSTKSLAPPSTSTVECADDPDGKFKYFWGHKTCTWLSGISQSSIDKYCWEGFEAREVCRATCGVCRLESPQNAIEEDSAKASKFECFDSPTGRFKYVFGHKDCNWLREAGQPGQDEYCQEGSEAWEICPAACGRCTDCTDHDDVSVWINWRPRHCSWLRDNPDEQGEACRKDKDVYGVCRKTCGSCGDQAGSVVESASIGTKKNGNAYGQFKEKFKKWDSIGGSGSDDGLKNIWKKWKKESVGGSGSGSDD